jgi:hypothetical protein
MFSVTIVLFTPSILIWNGAWNLQWCRKI